MKTIVFFDLFQNLSLVAAAAVLAVAATPEAAHAQSNWKDELVEYPARSDSGFEVPARLLRPAKLEQDQRYPLVLFLHGAGERGDDNVAQLKHGVGEFYKRRTQFPCFLLAPQCPEEQRWADVDWSAASGAGTFSEDPAAPMAAAWAAVQRLMSEEPIDPKRIYVTGLSMGGYGTWDAGGRYAKTIAAIAPVCGGGDPSWAPRYVGLPIWAAHGIADPTVPYERTQEMVDAITSQGGVVGLTAYPDVKHASWTPFYADDQVHRWLFEQQRDR